MLAAFDVGAEDYVVKPFSMKVLLKRIEVVLRRNSEGSILCAGIWNCIRSGSRCSCAGRRSV